MTPVLPARARASRKQRSWFADYRTRGAKAPAYGSGGPEGTPSKAGKPKLPTWAWIAIAFAVLLFAIGPILGIFADRKSDAEITRRRAERADRAKGREARRDAGPRGGRVVGYMRGLVSRRGGKDRRTTRSITSGSADDWRSRAKATGLAPADLGMLPEPENDIVEGE